jgi:hypothetical protein
LIYGPIVIKYEHNGLRFKPVAALPAWVVDLYLRRLWADDM